jgi:hypothetical protein
MPNDPVLAVLALLFLWLLARLDETGKKSEEGEEGPEAVKGSGLNGIRRIETLPSRPLASWGPDLGSGGAGLRGPFNVDPKDGGLPGTYRRYGYSLARERWLNDERPPGSGAIVEIIGRLPLVR